LSGKYNDGQIPNLSRLAIQDHPVINRLRSGFFSDEGRRKLEKIRMMCVSNRANTPDLIATNKVICRILQSVSDVHQLSWVLLGV
jgi:hypothetical protein